MDLWLSLFNLWHLLTGDEKGPQCQSEGTTETDKDFNTHLAAHDVSAEVQMSFPSENAKV